MYGWCSSFFLNQASYWFSNSLIGVDGVDEVRLLGGFQDVAALLNCLVGQQDTHSPTHQHSQSTPSHHHISDTSGTSVATVNKTEREKQNKYSSPSKTLKTGSCENQHDSGTTLKDPMIQSSLMHRKCNSLPRSRAPKIFVNNLHDYSQETAGCPVERGCYSLRRNRASSAVVNDTDQGTCYSTTHSCNIRIPPPKGFEENSLTPLSSRKELCQVCNAAALLYDNEWKNQAVPKRSRSSSTVSYIGSGSKLPSSLCSLPQPSSEVPCMQPSCEQERTSSCSDHQLVKTSNIPLSASCSCSNNQISVICTQSYKDNSSDKLFLLWWY